jgi:Tfp pilus assembly protein PilN
MKAVNLLPSDARRSFGTLRGLAPGTNLLLGALAAGFVLVVAFVVMSNTVTSKEDELTRIKAEQTAAMRQVAELKPYADLDALRESLLDRVKTLADNRYDWPVALDRVARAFPANATLTSFDGTTAEGGAGPKISLAGCTPTHDDVARLIDRLRAVKGVESVALQSSSVSGETSGDQACPHADQFKLDLALKAPAGAAIAATAAQPGTSTPAQATPAPSPAPATGATP